MTVYDRFVMELSNQQYFDKAQYEQILFENNLVAKDEYVKETMQKDLLFAVVDCLDMMANDIDVMSTISTEFSNIGQAYQYIEMRITNVKDKIASIPDEDDDYSMFSLMYTKGNVGENESRPMSNIKRYNMEGMTAQDIENIWRDEDTTWSDSDVDEMF